MMLPVPRPRLAKQSQADMLKEAFNALQAVQAAKGKALPWLARQLHTTTGWFPGLKKLAPESQESFLKQIRSGKHLATKEVDEALKEYQKVYGTPKATSARKALERARASEKWVSLTGGTIPGAIKAMAGGKAMPVMRAGWNTLPTWAKGLTGYMGYQSAKDVASTPRWMYGQPGFQYKSRLHHIGSELGSNLGFVATGGLPFAPMMAASYGAEKVLGLPGRILSRKPEPVSPEVLARYGLGGQ